MLVGVGVLALLVITAILADQPGFGDDIADLHYVRWGGWVRLACCIGISVGSALALWPVNGTHSRRPATAGSRRSGLEARHGSRGSAARR
jgi:hypothetical protein